MPFGLLVSNILLIVSSVFGPVYSLLFCKGIVRINVSVPLDFSEGCTAIEIHVYMYIITHVHVHLMSNESDLIRCCCMHDMIHIHVYVMLYRATVHVQHDTYMYT